MALFTFTSRLDGRQYEANWDRDEAVIRVDLASGGPAYPAWPSAPGVPAIGSNDEKHIDTVRCYEEGRLSHPHEMCPYKGIETPKAIAWRFGAMFR